MGQTIQRLIQFRWLLFTLSVVFIGFSCYTLKFFKFDSSPYVYFKQGYEPFDRLELMEETYGRDFKVFVMVSATEDDIFTPDHLTAIKSITDEVWGYDFVRRVDSITNFQYIEGQDDYLNVENLFTDEVMADPELITQRKTIALNDPDIVKRLVSSDGRHASISIALTMSPDEVLTPESFQLVERIYELEERIKAQYPKLEIATVGNLLSSYHGTNAMIRDISVLVPTMFVLMFVLLALLLRSVSTIFITLFIAIGSTIGALAVSTLLDVVFSMIAMNTVIICLTISVAHCIHIFLTFLKKLQTHSKADALAESLHINFAAVSLTSLMTAIGFLSLNTNDLPPAVALGNASAIGAMLAWLFSLTILPALVMLFPFKAKQRGDSYIEQRMANLSEIVISKRYWLLGGMGVLTVFMVFLSLNNRLNDRLVESIGEPNIFITDARLIDCHFGSMYINNYHLDSGAEFGITDPEYLRQIDKFSNYLRAQPEITSVVSFSDTIKKLNKVMNSDNPEYYRIPDNRQLISQYLLLYELSLPLGLDLSERITHDKRASLVSATMPTMDTDTTMKLDQRIQAWQAKNLPQHLQVGTASISTIWSYLTFNSLSNSIEGSFVALALISLVMLFLLRSVRYGVISLVPNMMPAIFGFGCWYLYSGEIGLGLMCVSIITIGIVVDDTVHFLVKYRKALNSLGNAEDAIRATFKQVGPALLITTVVLATGFATLSFSSVTLNSGLGIMTSIILVAAFVLDILLLPVLLLMFDGLRKPIAHETGSADLETKPVLS